MAHLKDKFTVLTYKEDQKRSFCDHDQCLRKSEGKCIQCHDNYCKEHIKKHEGCNIESDEEEEENDSDSDTEIIYCDMTSCMEGSKTKCSGCDKFYCDKHRIANKHNCYEFRFQKLELENRKLKNKLKIIKDTINL
jgi:hypothetical protein